jgi:hypothetical protein
MTTLQYEQCAEAEQAENATEASAKDKQETAAKIEEGKEEGERLSKEHAEEEQAEQNQAEQQPQS